MAEFNRLLLNLYPILLILCIAAIICFPYIDFYSRGNEGFIIIYVMLFAATLITIIFTIVDYHDKEKNGFSQYEIHKERKTISSKILYFSNPFNIVNAFLKWFDIKESDKLIVIKVIVLIILYPILFILGLVLFVVLSPILVLTLLYLLYTPGLEPTEEMIRKKAL